MFYGGMDPQAGPMLRQMEQFGMTSIRFFGGDGLCTNTLTELSGGAKTIGNVVCAEAGAASDKLPKFVAWKARYDAKYPNQFQLYAPYVYDATMILAAAMVASGSSDPRRYLRALAKTDYDGLTSRIQFDAQGDLKTPAVTLYRYVNGKKSALN